jgi:hypothetical protein
MKYDGIGKRAGRAAKNSFIISILITMVACICASAEAKSVYAITNHGAETITAYQIQGNQLEFPSANSFNHDELINVTVDSQRKLLFVTVEGGGIFCVDAETLVEKGYSSTPCELAGIVADELRQKIYAVGRQTNQLYIYTWDGNAFALIQQVTLANLGGEGAYGIALDKVSRRLYVANNTAMVQYYDVDDPDWAHLGSCNVGHAAMDVDVDSYRGYLYVGGYQESGSGYNYLIKHDLESEPNSNTEQDIGTMVVGVAVDPVSGLVYVTTWNGQVRVYDCSGYPFSQTYSVTNGAGPAGICVESSGISFTKDDGVSENDCRSPLDTVIYTLNWTNPTSQTFSDVSIIDFLPAGVNFDDFVEGVAYQPEAAPTANPNVIYSITDANGLDDITLPVGQSITVYLTKETTNENVYSFSLEANISDPNLGWIDNTEYDPNNPGTAEILAQPRATFFDYYGPGYTQPEGIQFFAANLGNAIQDGDIASFVYTATQPGCVVLTLVDYDTVPATLEEIIIRQTDPNDPNYVPQEPNEIEEPPVYSASSVSGVYNEPNHTVTWELGDIAPGSYGSVSFSVIVNEKSEPGMDLHNVAKLISGGSILDIATEDTPVCCWDTTDPNIIFVDKTANGNNNGTSWTDAYTDLQDALYRAENSTCENIDTLYIAQGSYGPGPYEFSTFKLLDGMFLFGGFPTGGCDFSLRNPKQYETILTGVGGAHRNETVMVMGDNSLLDGVIVQNAGGTQQPGQGILCENVSAAITNCVVRNNSGFSYGIYADNSDVEIKWCRLENNGRDGIRHIGNEKNTIVVENCQIYDNLWQGLYLESSVSTVKNTVICRNGIYGPTFYGIRLLNPVATPDLYNNTLAYNYNEAISYLDSDPNHVNKPAIFNCIIWYNNSNSEQFAGYKPTPHYSCIYDPNDEYGTSETIDSNHNFSHKPDFAYPYSDDPNVFINVHLRAEPNSFCKDKGSPGSYADQNDIDGEARVADTYVDVGADEINCDDVYNALDWNADGLVNMDEFARFSRAWLTYDPNNPLCDPNNPNYIHDANEPGYISDLDKERFNPICDLDSDLDVDLDDLMVFLDEAPWAWTACWRHDIQEMQQMSMMMGGAERMMSGLQDEPVLMETSSVQTFYEPLAVQQTEIVQPAEPVPPEKSIEEQIADLQEAIQFLESIGSDPNTQLEIQASDWQDFMDEVRNSLTELQEKDIITQNKVED